MVQPELSDRIMKTLSAGDYRPKKLRALARLMGIAENEYGAFREVVKALMKSGRLVMGGNNAVTLPETSGAVVGTFRANPRGFGFVVPDSPTAHGDLYIPQGAAGDAITGDMVRAKVIRQGKRGDRMLLEGRIIEVLNRANNEFVGELCHDMGHYFVRPDGNTLHAPIHVSDVGAKGAKTGDQVVVEIVSFPSKGRAAHGVIVDVLGERGAPGVDTISMIRQYRLPTGFSEEALQEARSAAQGYSPRKHHRDREDLTKLDIITVDPDDARDFDDAISIVELDDGRVELGVHIADVSHFVPLGGAIDRAAVERSTSVYFPRHVVPMLPELLSNGVCSLQERVPRLTKSAFIVYDAQGRVRGERFANSIIKSRKRLTYKQASRALEGKPVRLGKPIVDLVKRMEKLARRIQARRLGEGMLELDLPEPDLILDDDGEVVGVAPADASYSHKIIEMFMVEANEAVARLFARIGVPFLRRIHPPPDAQAEENLMRFLKAMQIKVPKKLDRSGLQKILAAVRDTPKSFPINLAILRSMQKAEYAPEAEGHFALAGEDYCHFTSPIRRYPDLTIHRLLDGYLRGRLKSPFDLERFPSYEDLVALGKQCSDRERRAEAAERELHTVKVLRLLDKHVGDAYPGVVTGTTNFGLFIQITQFLTDGLVRFADLPDDWWAFYPKDGYVLGQRSGIEIRIGDSVEVVVAGVDIATRKLDLAITRLKGKELISLSRLTSKLKGNAGKQIAPKTERHEGTKARRHEGKKARGRR